MKRMIVPTLAAFAAIPAVSAVEFTDGDLTLEFGGRLQARAEYATGTNADGSDFTPSGGNTSELDFYMRRVRFTTEGQYGEWLKFKIDMQADEIGQSNAGDNSDVGANVGIQETYLVFDFGASEFKVGKFKSFYLMADKISSSSKMFLEDAPNDRFEGGTAVGVEFKHKADMFTAGVSLKNQNADNGLDKSGSLQTRGDYLVTARVETSLKEEWKLKKLRESFIGSYEGFRHNLGLELGYWHDADESSSEADITANAFTLDYIIAYNQISAGTYLSFASTEPEGGEATDQTAFTFFGGYAIPQDNVVYEPALRIALIDNDTDADNEEDPELGGPDESGTLVDLGLNMYWDGHNNKTMVGLEIWTSEEGDGDSTIFRVQHQLSF